MIELLGQSPAEKKQTRREVGPKLLILAQEQLDECLEASRNLEDPELLKLEGFAFGFLQDGNVGVGSRESQK